MRGENPTVAVNEHRTPPKSWMGDVLAEADAGVSVTMITAAARPNTTRSLVRDTAAPARRGMGIWDTSRPEFARSTPPEAPRRSQNGHGHGYGVEPCVMGVSLCNGVNRG